MRVLNSVGVRSLIERKCRGPVASIVPGLRVESERVAAGTVLTARTARLSGRKDCIEVILAV